MAREAYNLLEEALKRPAEARAALAGSLLESLDFDEDFAISQEWLDEIRRRCDEIDSGKAKLIEGDKVISELRDKHS